MPSWAIYPIQRVEASDGLEFEGDFQDEPFFQIPEGSNEPVVFRATLKRKVFEEILPPDASSFNEYPINLVLGLLGTQSRKRQQYGSVPLELGASKDDVKREWTVNFGELGFHGRVDATAQLVLASDCLAKTGFAEKKGMVLWKSNELSVWVNEKRPDPRGSFDIEWIDFNDTQKYEFRTDPRALYHLNIGSDPELKLYLNSSRKDLYSVMMSTKVSGMERYRREVMHAVVGEPAYHEMFRVSIERLLSEIYEQNEDEFDGDQLASWQRELITTRALEVKQRQKEDAELAFTEVVEDLENKDTRAEMLGKLADANRFLIQTQFVANKRAHAALEQVMSFEPEDSEHGSDE